MRQRKVKENVSLEKGKRDNYRNIAIVGRAITIEMEIKKRSKNIIPNIKQRRLRAITLQVAIDKSSHFEGTNN